MKSEISKQTGRSSKMGTFLSVLILGVVIVAVVVTVVTISSVSGVIAEEDEE